jgi:hypothetical protein
LPVLAPLVGISQAVPVAAKLTAPVPLPPVESSEMMSPKVASSGATTLSASWVALVTVMVCAAEEIAS